MSTVDWVWIRAVVFRSMNRLCSSRWTVLVKSAMGANWVMDPRKTLCFNTGVSGVQRAVDPQGGDTTHLRGW
jgi:hypothetical protein